MSPSWHPPTSLHRASSQDKSPHPTRGPHEGSALQRWLG